MGNIEGRQIYDIILGQAKVIQTDTTTHNTDDTLDTRTPPPSPASNDQHIIVTNKYDDRGRLISSSGVGGFVSFDSYGNRTDGIINQTFAIINGQSKILISDTATSFGFNPGRIHVSSVSRSSFTPAYMTPTVHLTGVGPAPVRGPPTTDTET